MWCYVFTYTSVLIVIGIALRAAALPLCSSLKSPVNASVYDNVVACADLPLVPAVVILSLAVAFIVSGCWSSDSWGAAASVVGTAFVLSG